MTLAQGALCTQPARMQIGMHRQTAMRQRAHSKASACVDGMCVCTKNVAAQMCKGLPAALQPRESPVRQVSTNQASCQGHEPAAAPRLGTESHALPGKLRGKRPL